MWLGGGGGAWGEGGGVRFQLTGAPTCSQKEERMRSEWGRKEAVGLTYHAGYDRPGKKQATFLVASLFQADNMWAGSGENEDV